MDTFLNKHGVDVGKSFGLLSFNTALMGFYAMAMQLILGTNFVFNLGAPFGMILGAALWQHKAWSRILLLIVGWLLVVLLIGLFVAIPFVGTPTMSVGTTVVKNPPILKAVAFGLLLAPCLFGVLAVLYSNKARQEFRKLNHPPASTSSVVH